MVFVSQFCESGNERQQEHRHGYDSWIANCQLDKESAFTAIIITLPLFCFYKRTEKCPNFIRLRYKYLIIILSTSKPILTIYPLQRRIMSIILTSLATNQVGTYETITLSYSGVKQSHSTLICGRHKNLKQNYWLLMREWSRRNRQNFNYLKPQSQHFNGIAGIVNSTISRILNLCLAVVAAEESIRELLNFATISQIPSAIRPWRLNCPGNYC